MTGIRKNALIRACSPAEKILLDMVDKGFYLAREQDNPVAVVRAGTHIRMASACIAELLCRKLLVEKDNRLYVSDDGRTWVSHLRGGQRRKALSHSQMLRQKTIEKDGIRRRVTVNIAESPLEWLKSRQNAGPAMISAVGFEAGERLRQDYTFAQLSPRITTNWASPEQRSTAGDPVLFSDAVLAARQRFAKAMDAVGPELHSVLIDVVCFLKGLEQLEKERQWPARSAKVVLGLALEKLARHYGISACARGSNRKQAVRAWVAPDKKQA